MFKKVLVILLAMSLVLCFCACGEGSAESDNGSSSTSSSSNTSSAQEKDWVAEFKNFYEVVATGLGYFDSPSEISPYAAFGFACCFVESKESNSNYDDMVFTHHYDKTAIDNVTNRYFGMTYDYSQAVGSYDTGLIDFDYDVDNSELIIIFHGAFGGEGPMVAYVGCEQTENDYKLTYETAGTYWNGSASEYYKTTAYITFRVDGNSFTIVSHTEGNKVEITEEEYRSFGQN